MSGPRARDCKPSSPGRGASPPAPGADMPGTPDPRGAIAIWVLRSFLFGLAPVRRGEQESVNMKCMRGDAGRHRLLSVLWQKSSDFLQIDTKTLVNLTYTKSKYMFYFLTKLRQEGA